jgi:hypothetical protein
MASSSFEKWTGQRTHIDDNRRPLGMDDRIETKVHGPGPWEADSIKK